MSLNNAHSIASIADSVRSTTEFAIEAARQTGDTTAVFKLASDSVAMMKRLLLELDDTTAPIAPIAPVAPSNTPPPPASVPPPTSTTTDNKPKRGRPVGSKNAPKAESASVTPSQDGQKKRGRKLNPIVEQIVIRMMAARLHMVITLLPKAAIRSSNPDMAESELLTKAKVKYRDAYIKAAWRQAAKSGVVRAETSKIPSYATDRITDADRASWTAVIPSHCRLSRMRHKRKAIPSLCNLRRNRKSRPWRKLWRLTRQ